MLRLSHDRKVTNLVSPNGKSSKIANSFGLPSGKSYSCPGATSVCESVCYAGKLELIYSGVRNILLANYNHLLGLSVMEMADDLSALIDSFEAECERKNAEKAFRIHWDGDFFSAGYTMAWAIVISRHPAVNFWVYTRSFQFVPLLAGLDNLTTYLSVDNDNKWEAIECRKRNQFVHFAWLAKTFAEGKADIPSQKSYKCPENDRRIPLITQKGSACIRCGVCTVGRGDVIFSASKR